MRAILDSAAEGIRQGEALVGAAAARLSRPLVSDADVAADFVTLSMGSAEVVASARVAQVAEQDDKALLDMVA
jgi:hypothetical protein